MAVKKSAEDLLMRVKLAVLAVLLTSAASLAQTAPATQAPAPEGATGRAVRTTQEATRYMVAAANPLAAEAGREMLRAGGSAVDAAIAAQLVLNLVEPQSSGIGGGAFLVHWDARKREVDTLDGRETAPAAATPTRFMAADGKPMPFYTAVVGGRSVGVPGTPQLLGEAHERWGRLQWRRLFEPAIRLAENGFVVSPRLAGLLAQEKFLSSNPRAKALYYPDGKPLEAGVTLKNPALARTFRVLAEQGPQAFYTGEIAEDIVATVQGHPTNPGDMTLGDLQRYRVVEREPVCGRYRAFRVCGMGPPSSGAVAVQQMLGVLEGQPMARLRGADAAHWFAEAGRLAFADRALYLGDPAFVSVPVEGLIDPAYVKSRAALANPDRSMGKAKAGEPPMRKTDLLLAPSDGIEHGTSHISVVDAEMNAVSMTTTIEDGFGSRLLTEGGFLLNNELTDFNFAPTDDGKPVANRVEPGKRPRSSMAPTIVFDAFGRLYAVTGSPGGSQIIGFVGKTLVGLLDWKLDPQVAVDLPNMGSRNGPTELEAGTEAEAWKPALEAKGHEVKLLEMTSGIQAIVLAPGGFLGGADSRREGVAIGD